MSREFRASITVGIAIAGLIAPLYGSVENLDRRIESLNQRLTRVEIHLEYLIRRHQDMASVVPTNDD